jgi:uncharacterized membrane-anchored protein YitT (DUF2179 family)
LKLFSAKLITLGVAAILQGVAMAIFLFPHNIPSGGAAGISVLLHHIAQVPYALTLWTLNAGMLVLAIKWLGTSSAFWTIYCVTVTSLTINFISPHLHHPVSTVFIDLIIGSILFGIGVGILFRVGASSGGMDILALIISKLKGVPPGKTLFYINGIILLLTGILVDWKVIFYALVCQWIGTKMIDIMYKLQWKNKWTESFAEKTAS